MIVHNHGELFKTLETGMQKSRCLQTAEMLVQAFECDHCILYRGKRFLSSKWVVEVGCLFKGGC